MLGIGRRVGQIAESGLRMFHQSLLWVVERLARPEISREFLVRGAMIARPPFADLASRGKPWDRLRFDASAAGPVTTRRAAADSTSRKPGRGPDAGRGSWASCGGRSPG